MLISKKRIEETYNLQAENYKGSRQVAKLLLRDMQIPPNPTGLGIGCGDGVTTFELYDQFGKQGKVIGVDISQKMVEKAFENGRRLGYEDVRFMKMDAESLDFPDNMFDIVMSLFTFQFLPDKLKGFKGNVQSLEARRPSGPLLPNRKEFQSESFETFRKIEERHREFSQFSHVLREYEEMHITLEEFQDMMSSVGFTGLDVFGKHRIYYVNPKEYLRENPYPVDLLSAIPIEYRG